MFAGIFTVVVIGSEFKKKYSITGLFLATFLIYSVSSIGLNLEVVDIIPLNGSVLFGWVAMLVIVAIKTHYHKILRGLDMSILSSQADL